MNDFLSVNKIKMNSMYALKRFRISSCLISNLIRLALKISAVERMQSITATETPLSTSNNSVWLVSQHWKPVQKVNVCPRIDWFFLQRTKHFQHSRTLELHRPARALQGLPSRRGEWIIPLRRERHKALNRGNNRQRNYAFFESLERI